MKKTVLAILLALNLLLCGAQAAVVDELYVPGDAPEDFLLNTCEGELVSLYDLLQEHDAVLLNFFFTSCNPCRQEFPFLEEAYKAYSDTVAVLAISPYDDNDAIARYKKEMGITFPMAADTEGITELFVDEGFPTSVMIDRNGVICWMECGMITNADLFGTLFSDFSDPQYDGSLTDYELTSPKYRGERPDSDALSAAVGGGLVWQDEGNGMTWPFLPEDGAVVSSNAGVNGTNAVMFTNVEANAGDVLALEYNVSCECGYDGAYLLIDGGIARTFTGDSNGWQTYAYPFAKAGSHAVTLLYYKDNMDAAGEDRAAFRNVRLLSGAEAEQAAAASRNASPLEDAHGSEFEITDGREILVQGGDDVFGPAQCRFFIVPGQDVRVTATVGSEYDVAPAFVYTDYDQSLHFLQNAASDGNGSYTVELHGVDSLETTGYPCSCAVLYPGMQSETAELKVLYLFTSEEDFLALMENRREDANGIVYDLTYAYADGTPIGGDRSFVGDTVCEYVVRCADVNGAPVEGAAVQICSEDSCIVLITDGAGEAEFAMAAGFYDVTLLSVPEGHALPDNCEARTDTAGTPIVFTVK